MFEAVELADRCRKAALEDVSLGSDEQLRDWVVEVERARSALDAVEGHLLGELEARGGCDRDLGMSTGGWLAWRTRRSRRGCASRVRVGTALRHLDALDSALGEGEVGFEHAVVLGEAMGNSRVAGQVVVGHGELVELARKVPFELWRRTVGELVELWDQDGGYDPDRELARNRLRLRRVGDTTVVRGELVGETAVVVGQALESITDQLWRRAQADRDQTPDLPTPSRPTLRALGLAELCRRGVAASTATAPAVDVTLVIHTDQPDMVRTPDGDRVTPEAGAHLWCDPVLHTLLVDRRSVPLDMKRSARFATPAQRRALAVRDGGCVFPGCDRPPSWTDAHHLTAYQHGGATDLHNLASLCRHHHGVTHRQGWTMTATPDQTFTFTTPSGHTLHSQRHRAPP